LVISKSRFFEWLRTGAPVADRGLAVSNHESTISNDGIIPTLAELVTLRGLALGRRPPRRGRHGASGQALSPQRGRGMEYAESREYTPGDDARHIDWKLTARSGRPHTKLFQAERERLTLLVADTAPGLYFGTRTRFKSVQAARVGAVAAWAAMRDGDRVAALRGSVREAPVPPGGGARGTLRVLDALVRWYARPPQDDAGLAVALDHAQRLLRPGSRLVVLADPASIDQVPDQRWSALAAHSEVVAVLLEDALERDPPRDALPFSADGKRVELDLAQAERLRRWQREFNGRRDAALARLHARGVRAMALPTDAPGDAWLALFASARAA
jgi:uncharacterized protein (DUF58 family)